MSSEPPFFIPAGTPPPPPGKRPPVPGWMWLLFGSGMVPVGAVLGVYLSGATVHKMAVPLIAGGVVGAICGLPLVGGLALAGRFFSGIAGQFLGGLLFAALLVVGLAAAGFAGCMCLAGGGAFR